jgi:hypothetical protein
MKMMTDSGGEAGNPNACFAGMRVDLAQVGISNYLFYYVRDEIAIHYSEQRVA